MAINKVILDYLQKNARKFPKSAIAEGLRKAGYPEEDIRDSITANGKSQTATPVMPPQAWTGDMRGKKKTQSYGAKIGDFFIGFCGAAFLCWLYFYVSLFGARGINLIGLPVLTIGSLALLVLAFVYRKYIAIGMLTFLTIPLLLFGACLFAFGNL